MPSRILVLSDGETFDLPSNCAIYEITDAAFDRICGGTMKVKHLDDSEILLKMDVVGTTELFHVEEPTDSELALEMGVTLREEDEL